jgi:hypothetical protein
MVSSLFKYIRGTKFNFGCRYSTGSNLNTYSALIQNFYSQETAPHQAIHVALNTGVEAGESAGVKAYVRFGLSSLLFAPFESNHTVHPLAFFPNPRTASSSLFLVNYNFTNQNGAEVCIHPPLLVVI